MTTFDPAKTAQKLIKGIRDYIKTTGMRHAVVGLSGGIDSSLTFKLTVDALGSQNVAAIVMPELGVTNEANIEHAKQLAGFFNVKTYYQPINTIAVDYSIAPWKPNKLAKMNTKARIRANLLYSYANTHKALVMGTSNKSEAYLGYGTKYGDLAVDLQPLGNLFKTEVYALAEYLNLPREIIEKAPTAELEAGQTDEQELGAPYAILDGILRMVEENKRKASIVKAGYPEALVEKILRRIKANEHKGVMPPILET